MLPLPFQLPARSRKRGKSRQSPRDEILDFSAALADQGNDFDVGAGIARDHREQRALADAGAGHDRDTLSLAASDRAVDRANADIERLANFRPLQGIEITRV